MSLNSRRDVMGTQYLGVAGLEDEAEIADRTGKMLSRALNTGQAVCVAGSGLSTNYGFPIWRDFAEEAIATTKREHARRIPAHTKAYFDLLEKRLRKNERVTAEEIMTAFDVCAGFWPDLAFKRFVARRFQARASVGGPIARIIRELRIRRFLTTNYDDTIKQGLDACLGAGEAERYTIDSDGLLEFAVGTPGHRAGVFHLHGVVADESEQLARLIVTESDYQELYLREDPAARAYREAVSLLFTGNPILFVGMGLTEFDLLHPLRESAAQPRRDVDQAPLFALMPQPDPRRRTLADLRGEAVGQRRQIYTRYGIHVLFYPPIEKFTKTFDVAAEFDAALGRLAEHGLKWWDEWQRKPPVQTPEFVRKGRKGACMLHNPAFDRPDSFFALREDLDKIESTLRDRAAADKGCLAIAIGRAGMGKGGLGTRLVRRFDDVQYDRRFFATLHFTNDFMSIIDAAARHLDEGAHDPSGAGDDAPPSAMERLERALTKGRHLLVLGALERALEPFPPEPQLPAGADAANGSGRHVTAGRPSAEVAAFLNLAERAVRAGGKSHIVLTSAVTPVWREPGQQGPQAGEPLELQGVSEDEALCRFDGLIAARDTDRLRRVLGKHAYLMWLVMGALKRSGGPEERSAWAKRLFHRLSSVDRDRRRYEAVAAVIDVHIDAIASAGDCSRAEVRGDVVRVLETVSLFTTPVSAQTIADALAARNDIPKARTKKLLRELAAADLLLQVETRTRSAFTAHTAVRAFFLGRLGLSDIPGETHKFALAGYSAEVPVSQPGSREAHHKAARYVDALLDKAETGADPIDQLDALRAAFGIARARWSATGIARLGADTREVTGRIEHTHYGSYLRRLSRLANAARTIGGEGWQHWYPKRERYEASIEEGAAFFADELAWLYNELGLASFLRGAMPDAQALFRMGRGINEFVELSLPEDQRRAHRWAESHINLAIVATDRGRLDRAENHLGVALRRVNSWPNGADCDLVGRIKGHLALVHHLMGDYARAEKHYEDAIRMAEAKGNRRALSLFSKHYADLHRVRRSFPKAREQVRQSIAAAESARHYDVLQYARVAEAHLDYAAAGHDDVRLEDRSPGAASTVATLLEIERYARRAGLAKLEQETLRVHAQVVLRQGDVDRATRLTIRCLSIASANGLGLSLTRSLVLMGQVLNARGESDAARRLLRSTAQLAESQRYQLQAEAAERELLRLGIEDTVPGPNGRARAGRRASGRASVG